MEPDPSPRARPATPEDYPHFVRFFEELATGDPIAGPERYQQLIMPKAIFLERAGQVVGYGYVHVIGEMGHVGHVVIHPDCRGERLGGALMAAIADRLRAARCSRWCLNVKVGNTPALRLYERFGFAAAFESTALRFPWSALSNLERDGSIVGAPLDPSEDEASELRFGLIAGQLGENRRRPGRVMMRATDAATMSTRLGIASFDPGFPGTYPFRAVSEHAAAAMLDAIRPLALPDHDALFVTIDEDAGLTRRLLAAGAEMRFEMLHLRGSIPEPVAAGR